MSEGQRVEILREFLDTPFLGIPLIWYAIAIFLVCMACVAWVVISSRREKREFQKGS